MKTFPELDFNERVDWAAGYILLQLIQGNFRDAVYTVCNQCHQHPLPKPKRSK